MAYQILIHSTFFFFADFGLLLDFGRALEAVDKLLLELDKVLVSSKRRLSLKLIKVAIGMFSALGSSPKMAWIAYCTFMDGMPS